ncbi:hypothetical protein QBS70_09085 [Cronobacter sakazakii]|nr:hypothetical protein [Cronobacter sakazakii]
MSTRQPMKKIAQHALFIIYQSVLAHPLSAPAARQYDPAVLEIKNIIEQQWVAHEFTGLVIPDEVNTSKHYGDYLKNGLACAQGVASPSFRVS